jgi:hypothetical protein
MSAAQSLSMADLEAQVAQLREANARLVAQTAKKVRPISFKVSEKGCISVYGLQRFPVSLRPAQWERVLGASVELRAFATAHKRQLDALNAKDDDESF